MRDYEELERLWNQVPPLPQGRGRVELIVVRPSKGERLVPESADISPELGVHGDRWSLAAERRPDSQITLMNTRVAEVVAGPHGWERFGDNFLVDIDLSESALPVGTMLALGSARIQVTSLPHTGCKQYRERFGLQALRWINHKKHRGERLRGLYCRVIDAGVVTVGDGIEVLSD